MELKTTVKRILGFMIVYGFIFGLCTQSSHTAWDAFITSLLFVIVIAVITGLVLLVIWLFTSK